MLKFEGRTRILVFKQKVRHSLPGTFGPPPPGTTRMIVGSIGKATLDDHQMKWMQWLRALTWRIFSIGLGVKQEIMLFIAELNVDIATLFVVFIIVA